MMKEEIGNVIAPEGQIFVCSCCGKRSKDKYGFHRIDYGWDVSCVLNSVLCHEKKDSNGNYIAVDQ